MENERIKYYEDNMTKSQHIIAYAVFAVAIAIVFFIYYHNIFVAIIGGVVVSYFQQANYAQSVIKKRQKKLRLQFKEFLDIISISISGGAGKSLENAVRESVKELKLIYNADEDIVKEIEYIVNDFDKANIPMKDGFKEFGDRSDIPDIVDFATIYETIEGKSSDIGYVIARTRDIIKDKNEITMEIETSITAAKSEAYMMLILPLVIIVVISSVGGGLMDTLFTTGLGRLAATIGIVLTFVSYVLAVKACEIEV